MQIECCKKARVTAISPSQIGLARWIQNQEYLGLIMLLAQSHEGKRMDIQYGMMPKLVDPGQRVLYHLPNGKLERCLLIAPFKNCGREGIGWITLPCHLK